MPAKKSQKTPKSKPARPRSMLEQVPIHCTPTLPLELQQLILNIFRNALPDSFTQDLQTRLQGVKTALFNRDFAAAFGNVENLSAYAIRWSPSRALAYTHVFKDILPLVVRANSTGSEERSAIEQSLQIVCLGGGAGAELVAAGSVLNSLADSTTPGKVVLRNISMNALDIAPWGDVLERLHKSLVNPPPISKYSSTQVIENNKAMISASALKYVFSLRDALKMLPGKEMQEAFGDADLVTAFFTMNELFSTSIATTNTLLLHLKNGMKPGSYMLVVDSAGSYATVMLNGSEKTYPMHWLLDHTMLSASPASKQDTDADTHLENIAWTKLRTEESTWFRIPEGLKYPLELENMRYQLHLYQKNNSS